MSSPLLQNFLSMMFAVPSEKYEMEPDFVDALNLLLILHADHGQNCSTSTVRMVCSSTLNLFSSISAGICALWGALHGGANEACVNMLESIRDEGGNVGKYVDRAKDPNDRIKVSILITSWDQWVHKETELVTFLQLIFYDIYIISM